MKTPPNNFDYQWENLGSKNIEYNTSRIDELLRFTNLEPDFFKNKTVLDAGCGNGRYTYALQQLGAIVDSIDLSPNAIKSVKKINPNARVASILDLSPSYKYDFVLSWGVLHHTATPFKAFQKLKGQLKTGGLLHIMVYNEKSQLNYIEGRKIWNTLSDEDRLKYCTAKVKQFGGDIHGWFDALNPTYNFSYSAKEIKNWFKDEGYSDVIHVREHTSFLKQVRFRFIDRSSINVQGTNII